MKQLLLFLFAILLIENLYSQDEKMIDQQVLADSLSFDSTHLYTINDSTQYVYSRPKLFSFVPKGFVDIYKMPKQLWEKETIVPALGIAASTALLIAYDGKIYDGVRRFCDHIGLSPDNNTINLTGNRAFAFNIPTDLSSGLYYIGDGITEMGIAGGIWTYGLITKDVRAIRTASELAEGMVAVGATVQILKHITMRETPERRSLGFPNGKWRWINLRDPLGSIKQYASSVPTYDAYPSGHLITAMMTTTVIAKNYPEKKWIKPVGYTLMALCGFQMINNGVHWASDYPLAIGLGYAFGNMIVKQGRYKVIQTERRKAIMGEQAILPKRHNQWKISPALLDYNTTGLSFHLEL
ncbi:MAG: phosphatase PAP2 family protein [Bacteroidales bacterium]|nr:phosphatase PAP2 family protein [Bacteroidales bacterium]